MGSSLNKVMLIGRLGKDPDIRFTASGQAVANFTIATDESYTDRSGEKQKKTEWHNIVVWGKAVEAFVQPYIHKGDMVYVEGKLQTRSWDDKEGNKKYTVEINVMDIKGLVTQRSDDAPAAARNEKSNTTKRPVSQATNAQHTQQEVDDSDLPF